MIGITRGADAAFSGNITLSGSSTGLPWAPSAYLCSFYGATVETLPSQIPLYITASAAINIGTFIYATELSVIAFNWSTFTGFGNITGQKYNVSMNAVINSSGGGINYYPGGTAGVASSGGQYV
jgi:hypothetical protein